MTPTSEEWRPVVGYEGLYEVSDHGRVRSLDRVVEVVDGPRRYLRRFRGQPMRPFLDGGRTARYAVVLTRGGKHERHRIAPLVLAAFVGPRPPGEQACHNNGDATDDRLANLRWDTATENMLDVVRHGHHEQANKTHCPRGHRLESPNLVPSLVKRGRRLCLACNRTHTRFRKIRDSGRPLGDFKALSDANYARIMGAP